MLSPGEAIEMGCNLTGVTCSFCISPLLGLHLKVAPQGVGLTLVGCQEETD